MKGVRLLFCIVLPQAIVGNVVFSQKPLAHNLDLIDRYDPISSYEVLHPQPAQDQQGNPDHTRVTNVNEENRSQPQENFPTDSQLRYASNAQIQPERYLELSSHESQEQNKPSRQVTENIPKANYNEQKDQNGQVRSAVRAQYPEFQSKYRQPTPIRQTSQEQYHSFTPERTMQYEPSSYPKQQIESQFYNQENAQRKSGYLEPLSNEPRSVEDMRATQTVRKATMYQEYPTSSEDVSTRKQSSNYDEEKTYGGKNYVQTKKNYKNPESNSEESQKKQKKQKKDQGKKGKSPKYQKYIKNEESSSAESKEENNLKYAKYQPTKKQYQPENSKYNTMRFMNTPEDYSEKLIQPRLAYSDNNPLSYQEQKYRKPIPQQELTKEQYSQYENTAQYFSQPQYRDLEEAYVHQPYDSKIRYVRSDEDIQSQETHTSENSKENYQPSQYYSRNIVKSNNYLTKTINMLDTQSPDQRKVISMIISKQYPTNSEYENIYEAYEEMRPLSSEAKRQYYAAIRIASNNYERYNPKNATEIVTMNHYQAEEHIVKTEDGYLLTMVHILGSQDRKEEEVKPVVFLMHGLLGSSDDWVLMGSGKSLAFLLTDAGYDVWMGNARGNKYSQKHVSKYPSQADFWQFSNDEVALQDLPAMIDYTLKFTHQEKMFYVGFSQGNADFFALASTRPEYNEKITMMYAISPMAYMGNTKSPLAKLVAPSSPFYRLVVEELSHNQFYLNKRWLRAAGASRSKKIYPDEAISSNVNILMSGINLEQMDMSMVPAITRNVPAGASYRQIEQVGQAVTSNNFTMYNYGPVMNQVIYGDVQPKKYELRKVTTPVTLYYSDADWMASPADVEKLQHELPNVMSSERTPDFSNMNYLYGSRAPEMVYQKVIESMMVLQKPANMSYNRLN